MCRRENHARKSRRSVIVIIEFEAESSWQRRLSDYYLHLHTSNHIKSFSHYICETRANKVDAEKNLPIIRQSDTRVEEINEKSFPTRLFSSRRLIPWKVKSVLNPLEQKFLGRVVQWHFCWPRHFWLIVDRYWESRISFGVLTKSSFSLYLLLPVRCRTFSLDQSY